MEQTTEQKIAEILDRSRRTETRVVTLANHCGLDLLNAAKIAVHRNPDDFTEIRVTIEAMDVSLSRIVNAVKASELWGDMPSGCYEFRVILAGTGHRVGCVVMEKSTHRLDR
jgi:hypothetical protein